MSPSSGKTKRVQQDAGHEGPNWEDAKSTANSEVQTKVKGVIAHEFVCVAAKYRQAIGMVGARQQRDGMQRRREEVADRAVDAGLLGDDGGGSARPKYHLEQVTAASQKNAIGKVDHPLQAGDHLERPVMERFLGLALPRPIFCCVQRDEVEQG